MLLLSYVKREDTVLAIRQFGSFPKEKYDLLRRGFLSEINGGEMKYIFVDNYYASIYAKMVYNGDVPDIDKFAEYINSRLFPFGGRVTKNEKPLQGYSVLKNPQLNGWKLSHIIPDGEAYCVNGEIMGLAAICKAYFPCDEGSDWATVKTDATGTYHVREYSLTAEQSALAKKLLVAHYLRTVHPLNYLFTPWRTQCKFGKVKFFRGDVGEHQPLLDYARQYIEDKYGDIYKEFLSLIMFDEKSLTVSDGSDKVDLWYGRNIGVSKEEAEALTGTPDSDASDFDATSPSTASATPSEDDAAFEDGDDETVELLMAREYLANAKTSFRKLERDYLNIDSKVRGGGFIARKILGSIGVTADLKGILANEDIHGLISRTSGYLKKTLERIAEITDNL